MDDNQIESAKNHSMTHMKSAHVDNIIKITLFLSPPHTFLNIIVQMKSEMYSMSTHMEPSGAL